MPNEETLGLFQRVLLQTNGTITNLITLYTGEEIKVKKINQNIILEGIPKELNCPAKTPVIFREILLAGETNNYLYAKSYFVFERLPRSIQYKLLETDQPIGVIWNEEKLELYKGIIKQEAELIEKISTYFGESPETIILSRTFLIYHNGMTLGLITEKFPITYFIDK